MIQPNAMVQIPQTIIKANWINTAILAVIAISTVIIAIFLGMIVFHHQSNNPSRPEPISPEWEYARKEIFGVDPIDDDFEAFNSWLKEGWEPILKMDGERRYLMRRPKPTL